MCGAYFESCCRRWIKDLDPSIVKICLAIRFVRSSPARLEKFKACVEEEGINEKGHICLDVDIR